MLRSIGYPNKVDDLVVIEFRGLRKTGFTVKPIHPGQYRLFMWPQGMPDPDLFVHSFLEFQTEDGPPKHCVFNFSNHPAKDVPTWQWGLVKAVQNENPLADFANAASDNRIIAKGDFNLFVPDFHREVRTIAWSCHMPYDTDGSGEAILEKDGVAILEWFESIAQDFRPHVIWGGGDTSYSDGTDGVDFSNQVFDKGDWYHSPANKDWLRKEYRRMYRYYWSLPPMRRIMNHYPHLFIWDDHEIHDGWGSEGKHFDNCNYEMFKIAKEVAGEYILNAGPRIRRGGEEAHQGYIMGPMASFIFDTRSTRNYEAPRDRLISRQQFQDFVSFLDITAKNSEVTSLVTCTSVPFVNMRTWVMELGTRAPDFLNDNVIQGVRDDIRDSWTSPGNIDTLEAVLDAIKRFMHRRPDVGIYNISGDIHVANAYEIHIPGTSKPIYQVTTSAITNRHHPPKLVEELTEIGDGTYINGVGQVRRIWPTVTDPNILCMDIGANKAELTLKVRNETTSGIQEYKIKV